MYHYKKDDTSWGLCCGEDETLFFSELSIVYTNEDGCCSILKHGAKDTIEKYHSDGKPMYKQMEIDIPILIHVDRDASLDDVNFVLDHSAIPEHYQRVS